MEKEKKTSAVKAGLWCGGVFVVADMVYSLYKFTKRTVSPATKAVGDGLETKIGKLIEKCTAAKPAAEETAPEA